MKICGIYKIMSPLGKVYIGQSIDVLQRFRCYNRLACKGQRYLYNSFEKYGVNKHKFEIICQCSRKELNDLEVYYIELYQCFNSKFGLNLQIGGGEYAVSDETRLKMSKSAKAKKPTSEETKKKMSKAKLGKIMSDEAKEKLRIINTGRKMSGEAKLKMSVVQSNRSPEWRKKIGDSHKGKVISEETIEKMKLANMGEKNGMFGKAHSAESREKMCASKKNSKPVNQIEIKTNNVVREWRSSSDAERCLSIKNNRVGKCCRGDYGCKTVGGFRWEFVK